MKSTEDPETARYLRRKKQRDGVDNHDDQEEGDDADFLTNPMKNITKHGKKNTEKNLEKQVQYFGNAIEPFHMQRDQEDMGEFDDEGFFLFKRKRGLTDAWLDSVRQAEDGQVADHIAKRIKS